VAGSSKNKPAPHAGDPAGALAPEPRKAGRPVGSKSRTRTDVEKRDLEAKNKATIVDRQRQDCAKLATQIKRTRDQGDHGPGDIGKLVKATETLHAMEREAHDFGSKGQDTNAVLVIPLPASTMAQWAVLAGQVLPATLAPPAPDGIVSGGNVAFEDEIRGEPEAGHGLPGPGNHQEPGPEEGG